MKSKQRGFLRITGKDIILMAIITGIVGWAVIEGLIWLFGSFVHVSFGVKP